MKKSLPWILLGVSVVLNAFFIGGFVHAQIQHARAHSERGARALMAERLNLSDEQRDMLHQSRRETMEEARAIFEAGRETREAFWAEMARPAPDPAVLTSLTEKAAADSIALSEAVTARMVETLAKLAPEQREILIEALERRPLLGGRYLPSGGELHGGRPRFGPRRFGALDGPHEPAGPGFGRPGFDRPGFGGPGFEGSPPPAGPERG